MSTETAQRGHFERPIPCPGRLALCGVPCGCQGRNPSHRPTDPTDRQETTA